MTDPTLDTLTQRLDRLERERRRLKLTGTLMLVGVLGVVLMGLTPRRNPSLDAERFQLKDANGTLRASLAVLPDGSPALSFYDDTGNRLVSRWGSIEAIPAWCSLTRLDGHGSS